MKKILVASLLLVSFVSFAQADNQPLTQWCGFQTGETTCDDSASICNTYEMVFETQYASARDCRFACLKVERNNSHEAFMTGCDFVNSDAESLCALACNRKY